jgi:hypothetical protein
MKSIAFLLLWVSSGLAWAGILQGTVKDSDGHPIQGAEIRIDGKTFTKTIKTDSKGHYVYDGLVAGTDCKVNSVDQRIHQSIPSECTPGYRR